MDNTELKTVVIVDDAFANRMLLNKIFSDHFRVETAQNGAEALELLRRLTDVVGVVLDLYMPVLDGYGVLEAMRADPALSDIPVVVVTASGDADSQIKALDCGAVDVIVKPFNPRLVQHRVRNLIDRRRADRLAEENRLYAQRIRQAEIDEKTGIYTRQAFCRSTAALLAGNPGGRYVMLRWDIDRFKVYNDAFGVSAGDVLLSEIGRIYREQANDRMTYGYWGADHFVCCMELQQFDPEKLSRNFSAALSAINPAFDFTTRLGAYVIDDPSLDVALMCDRALMALRSVKHSYSERFAYYDETMRAVLVEEQRLVSEMQPALDGGQFSIYIQPQYNYADGTLHGGEVLVRWLHPEQGLIPPGRFIPIFEKNGFITRLDACVWRQTCALLRSWLDEGLPVIPLSVNISRQDIYGTHLCETISALIGEYRLPASLLRLEITESAYMDNPEQLIRTVEELRGLGFHVEMDDFGSGYSSLNTLKDVPVDMLKLDMNFLGGSTGTRSGSILSATVRMANMIGLPVLAEGVEQKEQADFLKSIGCLYMQGYYFARPMSSGDFTALLRAGTALEATPVSVSDGQVTAPVDFLDPSSQAALIFNSFVGGAGIIERTGDEVMALRLNDAFFVTLGTTRKEYLSYQYALLSRFDDENREKMLAMLRAAAESGEEEECELCSHPLSGRDANIWTRVRVRYLTSNAGSELYYMAVDNITHRRELMRRNEELREELANVIDSIPGAVINFEVRGNDVHIVFINDAAAIMFGFTREEFAARFFNDPYAAVHPDDLPALRESVRRVLLGEVASVTREIRHVMRDGGWRRVKITGRLARRTSGCVIASVLLIEPEDDPGDAARDKAAAAR